MAQALLLAWSSPVDDASDREFAAWYEGTHIPQVRAAIPAITAVHRYTPADLPDGAGTGAPPTHRYLAVYELDTDDVAADAAALGAAMAEGKLDITTTIDLTVNPPVLWWYQGFTG
jgi:EthD domain